MELVPVIYVLKKDGKLSGMVATHIDDFVYAGHTVFNNQVMKKLRDTVLVGSAERKKFTYVGWELEQNKAHEIQVSQSNFLGNLQDLELKDLRKVNKSEELGEKWQREFRSAVGGLNWLSCNTRPDLAFDIMELSTRFGHANAEDLRRAGRLIKKAKERDMSIKFPKLGKLENSVILVYADGAFSNLSDNASSTAGKVILLVGEEGKSAPIQWGANKIDRVMRSPLAAETSAMMDGIDEGHFIRARFEDILGMKRGHLDMVVITDSKSLREAVETTGRIKDKRVSALRV